MNTSLSAVLCSVDNIGATSDQSCSNDDNLAGFEPTMFWMVGGPPTTRPPGLGVLMAGHLYIVCL